MVTISVLGPLSVDGEAASSLAPRDRVILEVLVLHLGQVVSAERLADAMWADAAPPTWSKVVQGSVVRLRKVLGSGAIETSPAGYRLTTPPDQVDTHRFERLAKRASELLAVREYDRAAHVSGEALALWRGPALHELDWWDAARIEAGRLGQLRLDTEEIRLEAALRAGRHREVLAEAQARAAEAPLRERRWALLALAQYQTGRQGDALRTLHEARETLVAELGIDPGSELVALEDAILRQDPSLATEVWPEPAGPCPYLGLVPYDVADTEAFFGREREVETCLGRLATVGVLLVVGPSGSGKSSLVRAGIAAALQRSGRPVVVITPGARPTDALIGLCSSDPAPVLVVDQCEEAVTLCDDSNARAAFFSALHRHAGRAPLIVALRADRLGELSAYAGFARLVEPGLHLLSAMSGADLRVAIEGPARQAGLLLEPGLVDLLLREVEGEPGALPLLSHALNETWQRREGRTLTVDGYLATGGIRGSVAQSAEALYHEVPEAQRPLLRDLLLRLVTPTPEGEPVRTRIPRRTLAADIEHERLIELLVQARLVITDDQNVELAHESLARAWPRLQTWLDDDVEGQRMLRHLSLTADAWDGMGRPDSELYRGVRLAQALQWQNGTGRDLTPTERAFLEASDDREQAEASRAQRRLRDRARQNRRLRTLLAGVAALLIVAVVAGLLAVRQASRADRAATAADARRVGAQALLVDDIDRSLLLAVEGVRLDESTDTRADLLAALSRNPSLIGSTREEGTGFISVEASPDGEVVAVGTADGSVSFYDAASRKLVGSYDNLPVWDLEFRKDGRQLAVVAQDSPGGSLRQPPVRLVDAATFEDEPVQLGRVPAAGFVSPPHYSADGRFLAAGFANDSSGDAWSVVVWNLSAPQRPTLELNMGASYELDVELSPDGSRLYVAQWDPQSITAFDVATGRSVLSAPVGAWRLDTSPDGSLLAAAGGNDIVILDTATLIEQRRLDRHADGVRAVTFSPSGALLASGSDDRTAIIWDVVTGERRDVLTGHAAAVWGVGFSPDSTTLYTAGLDDALLTWDLVGDRRFIPRRLLNASVAPAQGADISPTGDAVAYTGCLTEDVAALQFLDIARDRAGPLIDTRHRCYGFWTWRPDGRRYATAGDDGFVRVWDWQTGDPIAERHVAPMHITSLDYMGDGTRLVVVERGGATYALDAETLEPDGEPVQLSGEIENVYASPDNRSAVVLTTDHFSVVDLDRGRVEHDGDAPGATAGEFSPDGHRFALGGHGEVRILDIETGRWIGPPRKGHTGAIRGLDYAPDGATFATAAEDGAIVIWDARTGARLDKVLPSGPSAGPARFLEDGHTLLIASSSGAIHTMDIRPAHWIEMACAIAGRNLTDAEWKESFGDRPYHSTCQQTNNT
jgi:WD40 repeat protein/DNA-binding SARP family transcriptional activator